ncbi:MAG: gliding motility-associated C-terminal domain-containing protein, partial [Bacteroidales bacterium]|nr:gliding motility-associated C-terminal domain-containing protein [Bacteroidales bacterium]
VSPEVTEYRIASSSNGSAYITEGMTGDNDTTYTIEDFESYSEYCFYIEASLSDGSSSLSNKLCLRTDLPVPPEWINADYATYSDDGSVMLSFTIDPATEYDRYRIERSNNISSGFEIIHNEYTTGNRIEYTDNDPPEGINYYYLAALNNCNEAIVYSNAASTIKLDILSDNKLIMIRWNSYYEWRGGVSSYRITRNNRGYFEEIATISGSDTVYTDNLNDFLYESSQEDICYRVLAEEGFNSYVSSASSHSDIVCIEQPARIFVPNAFTPGGNSINSVFMPVLSFTPVNFRMIIKNRSGLTLFESKDHLLGWDGTYGGRKMPEDVYIWFLETETPGARTIKRNGTIAVIYNQDHP